MRAADDPLIESLAQLIQQGDVDGLAALLAAHPALARDRIGDAAESRTVLHLATDWPGHLPRVGETIALLAAAGAPVDGRFAGPHEETPLHWAASCDDIAALDALLEAGADIEADGAVLTGGTPLSDAVVFAQWNAARRLVERGASMTLWQAAAVDDEAELVRLLSGPGTTGDDITNACWHACRAGSLSTARILASEGADLDWVGYDNLTPRQAGLASGHAALIAWLSGE
jgi:ankyrin repeat protein